MLSFVRFILNETLLLANCDIGIDELENGLTGESSPLVVGRLLCPCDPDEDTLLAVPGNSIDFSMLSHTSIVQVSNETTVESLKYGKERGGASSLYLCKLSKASSIARCKYQEPIASCETSKTGCRRATKIEGGAFWGVGFGTV